MKIFVIQKEYQIVSFKKIHIPKIMNLYNLAYNREKPLKTFNYKLDKTPYGNPIGYLMKYKKIIVGFYVIIPIVIKLKNKKVKGGLSVLTMTHPEHQRKGIFKKLAKKTYNTAKKRGYKFVVSFSVNKNSVDGFKKLGFFTEPIYHRNIFSRNKKIDKYPTLFENKFPNEIEKLWEYFESKNEFNIQPFKNKKYFDWRYIKNPTKYYTIFQKGKYFIILKKYRGILNIVDFFGNVSDLNKKIIDIAIKEAKRMNCHEITTWWPNTKNLKIDKSMSKKIKTPNYFVIKKIDSNLTSEILELRKWYFTMADSDIF